MTSIRERAIQQILNEGCDLNEENLAAIERSLQPKTKGDPSVKAAVLEVLKDVFATLSTAPEGETEVYEPIQFVGEEDLRDDLDSFAEAGEDLDDKIQLPPNEVGLQGSEDLGDEIQLDADDAAPTLTGKSLSLNLGKTSFSRDANGEISGMEVGDHKLTFTRDLNGNLSTVEEDGQVLAIAQRDVNGFFLDWTEP